MNNKSQVEYMFEDLRKMVTNVIIKSTYLADKYETADTSREADRYIAAYLERDTFNSYRNYPIDVLVNAGITNASEIMVYTEDRHKIPRNKRKDVLKAMRKAVIDEYVENNDYYRELIGKPPIDTPESEFIYLTEEEMEYYKIDEVRPIHDYPLEILIKLERIIIPNLIKQYPERTYLTHMGSKAVNLVRARQAKNFEIIYTDILLDYVFMRAFFETYDFCREYFVSLIYNKQFKTRYDLYDNYIGMHIMIMTIQRMIADSIKVGLERDFYDLITIQKLFNAYGVPFFEDLPLDYQRTIVKNLNKLIRSKSTDKVLYDIANTLFYERVSINKYYLVKERKFQEDGEPVTLYKNVAIEGDPEKIYLKNKKGKIYQLTISNDRLQTVRYTNPDEVKTFNEIYLKDRKSYNKYRLYLHDDKLVTELIVGVEAEDHVYVYDIQNKRYELSMTNGVLTTIEKLYEHIDDYSQVNTVKVIIRSSDNCNYELAMQGDRLTTVKLDNHSIHAPKSIYIKDEMTGEKFKLFMTDNVLYAEETFDEDIACQSMFLYDAEQNRYKLTVNKNKLQTSEYYYTTIEVYDYEKMYDFYFQSTDILEKNPITMIENKYNRYDYDEVVEEDVYWWETEELKKELYERDYNFIDTKYIGINIMQNLTNLLYESSYFLNMLVDHKNTTVPFEQRILNSDAMMTGTDYLFVTLNRFSTTPISIFDTVVILCALVSKKNNMKGNIIVKNPAQILSVLGFNFELNFDLIRENIQKYKRVFKNQDILRYLDLLDIRTVEDINTLYNNFRNFAEFCENVIATTTDINEYRAYKELYKVITVRKDTTELFKLSDGTVASTYMDYLRDKLPYIAEAIENIKKDDTGVYIEHVLGKLNELVPKIEYLNTLNGTNNNIVTAIVGLINFFKSYTVDLRNLNVIYMFDNKRMNKIFMIDDPRFFIRLFPEEQILGYNDEMRYLIDFDRRDNLIIYTGGRLENTLIPKEHFETEHNVQMLIGELDLDETMQLDYKDTMEFINKFGRDDIMYIKPQTGISNSIIPKNQFLTEDILKLYNLINVMDDMDFDYRDVMELKTSFGLDDNIKLNTFKTISNIILNKDYIPKIHDMLTICILINVIDKMEMNYKDLIERITLNFNLDDRLRLETFKALINVLIAKEYGAVLNDELTIQEIIDQIDKLEINYKDLIEREIVNFNLDHNIKLNTFKALINRLTNKEYFTLLRDDLVVNELIDQVDFMEMDYKDVIANINNIIRGYTKLKLDSFEHIIKNILCSHQHTIYDESNIIGGTIYTNDMMNIDYTDILFNSTKTIGYDDKLIFNFLQHYLTKINKKEGFNVVDSIKLIHED